MSLNDDDSIFEQALRSDLPSPEQEERMRRRLVAVGLVAGSSVAASGTAAAAPVGSVASALAKLGTLSAPVKFGLAAMLAVPTVAVPLWLAPKLSAPASDQRLLRSASSSAPSRSGAAARIVDHPLPRAEPTAMPVLESEVPSGANALERETPRAAQVGVTGAPSAVAREPRDATSKVLPDTSRAPAVASFEALHSEAARPAREPISLPKASTLAAETELLDRAFAELTSGHRAAAARLIAEHERQFPNGLLRQERERARARLNQDPKGQ